MKKKMQEKIKTDAIVVTSRKKSLESANLIC